MNFFCKATLVANQNTEKTIFVVLEMPYDGSVPILTQEILVKSPQYRIFVDEQHAKTIAVDFIVYRTESEINAAMNDEAFTALIDSERAVEVSSSELFIEGKVKSPKVRVRKGSSNFTMLIACGICLFVGAFGGFILVNGILTKAEVSTPTHASDTSEATMDGMWIPEQEEVIGIAKQITVTIDRSDSAMPAEDIILKGTLVDGQAEIEMPTFDRTDFFTHVYGYTWGFASSPNAGKIEYFSGETYTFKEDVKLYRVLVKYGGGSGTKNDPYLIDYYDQLELMSEEKTRGYFKQTEDIVFPDYVNHVPIDTVNELKSSPDAEYFEYDGGGYSISGINNSLFGTVSGATIKNVNITNSSIMREELSDVGFIVCNAYNYRYKTEDTTYETGETLIQNCSVSHSAISFKAYEPEVKEEEQEEVIPNYVIEYDEDGNIIEYDEYGNRIQYDEDGNPINPDTVEELKQPKFAEHAVGAISGIGGQIEGCYVTDFGIYANQKDYLLYAGGLSGKPANVSESVVNLYSCSGNIFYAGGLVGSASGSRLYDANGKELPEFYGGCIQGCAAHDIILTSELAAGGIAGEGGSEAEYAIISNCFADAFDFSCGEYDDDEAHTLLKAGTVGGIIAVDGKSKYGHWIANTVSLVNYPVIGKKSASSFDNSVRIAPDYAFYQENILMVLNCNTVHPNNPKEIYTGTFMFGENGEYGNESGSLAFPQAINNLFEKTEEQKNE